MKCLNIELEKPSSRSCSSKYRNAYFHNGLSLHKHPGNCVQSIKQINNFFVQVRHSFEWWTCFSLRCPVFSSFFKIEAGMAMTCPSAARPQKCSCKPRKLEPQSILCARKEFDSETRGNWGIFQTRRKRKRHTNWTVICRTSLFRGEFLFQSLLPIQLILNSSFFLFLLHRIVWAVIEILRYTA